MTSTREMTFIFISLCVSKNIVEKAKEELVSKIIILAILNLFQGLDKLTAHQNPKKLGVVMFTKILTFETVSILSLF